MKTKRFRFLLLVSTLSMALSDASAQLMTFAQAVTPQPYLSGSEIIPAPNATLYQIHVMFEHPAVSDAAFYDLRIYEVVGRDSLLKIQLRDSNNVTPVTKLEFGKSYEWFYTAFRKTGKPIFRSPMYTFSVASCPADLRIRVTHNDSTAHNGGLISFDYHGMIADRRGNPVWFLPSVAGNDYSRNDKVRDLRITHASTCTFITQRNAFEITYDGRVLWRGPKAGKNTEAYIETLHHGVERLSNGNMLTAGNHTMFIPVPGDTANAKSEFGVLAEYTRTGRLVWKWDSYNYISPLDYRFVKTGESEWIVASHLNAFRAGESDSIMYAGFRDLDRIVKINRNNGSVLASWGKKLKSGEAHSGDNFFHAQHDVTLLRDGNIAVFNNDSVSKDGVVSSVVIFSPAAPGEESGLIWKFNCDFDGANDGRSEKCGSVDEQPNGNLLVNFGTINRCVEISRDKVIVWNAFTESYNSQTKLWMPAGQYRSHWSSSMYPCYFGADIINRNRNGFDVRVWNEGSEADSYTVQYKSSAGAWVEAGVYLNVAAKTRVLCRINSDRKNPVSEVRVVSGKNNEFVRIVKVPAR
jgi:hypothetical protein